jgi:8-oxo-dGTP pyrophosphatase MutT (NUDIX family)
MPGVCACAVRLVVTVRGRCVSSGAVRESLEEAGYHVEVTGLVELIYGCFSNKNGHHRGFSPMHYVVVARVTGGDLKTVPDAESRGAVWAPLEDVLRELEDPGPKSVAKYRKPEEVGPILRHYAAMRAAGLAGGVPLL